ncbi:MAG: efflux RND transporter periplasmic adaptor subunit, partial [Bacteroides sp.]|nr:efflux RND transporter periplasmic adaptor subunit [Bacteroides sp.]
MKKILFMGVMGMFLLGSCGSKAGHEHDGHDHEGHNHATENHSHEHEGHNHEGHDHAAHDHEGHNHEAENHEGHNHEGHNHAVDNHEGHNHAAESAAHEHGNNPDEIILAPEKAKAAGVVSEVIEPKGFRQVIATSGQIQAAQGAESVVVANVSGVVSFQRAMTDGASVGKGATILSICADKLQDGDPAERARIAYETAKAEYDRAQRLVGSQIISQKEFNAIKETYENARLSYEALTKSQTNKGVAVTAPIGGYIKNLLVKEGDFVTVGQPLLTVTQNNRLYLRADVSERYYRYLSTISSA